jgi:polysaccharide biosynthesis/export protein
VVNPNVEQADSNALLLNPMDVVFVRSKAEMLRNKLVSIDGQVLYPGSYPILYEGEALLSLIERAGGLRKTAYLDGLQFTRANIGPIAINLFNDSATLNGFKNIALMEGDAVIIPQKQTLISVQGEVQNGIVLQADPNNNNVEYYISAAGGFGAQPWKNKIYVKYPNGVNKSTRRFLLGRVYPRVTPGCTIVVPRKPDGHHSTWTWRDSQGFFVSILSIATTAATTWKILSLSNK